jgi:hypothetical protein
MTRAAPLHPFVRRALLLLAVLASLAGSAALAQDAPAIANPVLLPETGLTIDAGAALRIRPTHLGADAYTYDVLPVVDGQWGKDLHFSVDDGIQYTAIRWGRVKLGPDLEYRQPYNDKLAPRTPRTSDALEAGGFAKVDLTYAELDVRVRKAVDGYKGYSGDVALDTLIPVTRKWFVALEGRLSWADRRFALDAFGNRPLPGQPAVSNHIGDYYTAGVQTALIYMWRPKTKLILGLSADQILRPSRGVIGTDTRTVATLFLAAVHRFRW